VLGGKQFGVVGGLFKPARSLRCGRVDIMDYGSENMPRIELAMITSPTNEITQPPPTEGVANSISQPPFAHQVTALSLEMRTVCEYRVKSPNVRQTSGEIHIACRN
jgi:hypothetical protein